MGIEFLKTKAQQFKHKSNIAFEDEFNSSNLFSSKEDIFSQNYRCKINAQNLDLAKGDTLIAQKTSSGKVAIFLGAHEVGEVVGAGASDFADLFHDEPMLTNLLPVEVKEPVSISKHFTVKLKKL